MFKCSENLVLMIMFRPCLLRDLAEISEIITPGNNYYTTIYSFFGISLKVLYDEDVIENLLR